MKIKSLIFSCVVLGTGVLSHSALANEKFVVAASPIPHAEILEVIKPTLAKEGIDLEVKEFTDYVQPNIATEEKEVDANFFQHLPYLDSFNQDHGTHLVYVGSVHVEPFGLYSYTHKSLKDIPSGAVVAFPNDPTNGGRALLLLQKAGLIELKDSNNLSSTTRDVVKNELHLKLKELDAALLPRALDDVDFALINTNYALKAGLNPLKDALLIEDEESPYANGLVVLEENKDNPLVQKVMKALQSEEVKQFIHQKYDGAIVPAFEK